MSVARTAAALFLLATAAAAAGLMLRGPSTLAGDALDYHVLAVNLASTGRFTLDGATPSVARPPGYPLFLAAVYRVFGERPVAALAAQCVVAGAGAALLFLLALPDLGPRPAALAGASAAVHPVLAAYASIPLAETVFIFLMLASLLLYRRYLASGRGWELGASGALMALACLTKALVLYFPAFWLGLEAIRRRGLPRAPLAWAAAFVAVLAPWTVRNKVHAGALLPVSAGGGYALWAGAHTGAYPDSMEYARLIHPHGKQTVEGDRAGMAEARRMYLSRLPNILLDLPRRSAGYWLTSHSAAFGVSEGFGFYRRQGRIGPLAVKVAGLALQVGLLGLAAWGIALAWRLEPFSLPLALILFTWAFPVLTDYGPNRYHVPAIPLLLVFAVYPFRGAGRTGG